MNEWISAETAPTDDQLEFGSWGLFWCYLPDEERKVGRYHVKTYNKLFGWKDGGVSHWMELPQPPNVTK